MSGTFELVTYPSFNEEEMFSNEKEISSNEQVPQSFGFTANGDASLGSNEYSLIDSMTPVLSLASTDSLFQDSNNGNINNNNNNDKAVLIIIIM